MAGDDVPEKKPHPSIYRIAAERLQLTPAECLVVEDSTIGLRVGMHALQSEVEHPMCCSKITAHVPVRVRVQHSNAHIHCCMPRCPTRES
jgi:FMN phosphatase YigB (HAD superfamily)